MSIADTLVANETIELSATKHWIAPVRDSAVAILLLLGAYFLNWLSPDGDGLFGAIGNLIDMVRVGLVVAAIGWIAYNIIVWRTAEFAVTNLRVIREEGFLSRRASATMLASVSDVRSKVGMAGKSLGYGDIEIYTQSGDAGADRFKTIVQPEAFRGAVMARKMADLAGQPAAAAVAPGTSAPPAASTSSADAADALGRLADLRDRGAITAEEYDAKKAEILARI